MLRRMVPVLVTIALASISVSTPASAAPAVDQVSPLVSTNGSAWIGSNYPTAQLFVPQVSGDLTRVSLPLARNAQGSVFTNFTVSVYATSEGVPTGQPLASVAFGQSDVNALSEDRSNPPSTVDAVFTNPPEVTAGTAYAIRVTTTDTGDAYHWFSGTYCLDSVQQSPTSNGRWLGSAPLAFSTYVDGTLDASIGIPKPVGVRPTAGSSSATLSFGTCSGSGAPADYGITNYEFSLDGGSSWQALSPADATSPVTVPGLTNGVASTIKLRAVTSSGTGPASDSVAVTPVAQRPSEPAFTSVVNIPGGAWLSFSGGEGNGSPILRYEYELDFNGEWIPTDPGTSSPVSISGLANDGVGPANDIGHWIRLRAVNEAGASSPTYYESFIVPGIPDAPAGIVATPVAGGISVAYTPCFEGAAPITEFEFDTGQGWVTSDATTIWGPVVISGLTDGTPVAVKLRAVNSVAASFDSETITVTPGAGQPVVSGATTTCSRPGPTRPVSSPPSSGGSAPSAPQTPVQVVSQQPVTAPSVQTPITTVSTPTETTALAEEPTSVVRVTKPAANTVAQAPVVKVSISEPIQIQVSGLRASTQMSVQRWLNGRWRMVGTVKSGPAGGVRTPEITAAKSGGFMIRIGNAKDGWKFVRVVAE